MLWFPRNIITGLNHGLVKLKHKTLKIQRNILFKLTKKGVELCENVFWGIFHLRYFTDTREFINKLVFLELIVNDALVSVGDPIDKIFLEGN